MKMTQVSRFYHGKQVITTRNSPSFLQKAEKQIGGSRLSRHKIGNILLRPKMLKLIHFLKEEIFEVKKRKEEDFRLFWESFGSWKDERSPEEIIKEIYASRKSTDWMEE